MAVTPSANHPWRTGYTNKRAEPATRTCGRVRPVTVPALDQMPPELEPIDSDFDQDHENRQALIRAATGGVRFTRGGVAGAE